MPFLHNKPLEKKRPSSFLRPEDKVFYCDLTNEVFVDYDEYWERLVLCNATVWTCSFTGRPNLTYEEGLACEAKAKKCLSSFPQAMKMPILFLAKLTSRTRFSDMSDDIFYYARDRYFVGEEVEAIVGKHWYDCRVLEVVFPTKSEVEKYELEMSVSDEDEGGNSSGLINGDSEGACDDDIKIVAMVNMDDPPYATFKYVVEELSPWDYKECRKHTVGWEQIRRNKSVFTREKCKLFLKQHVQLTPNGYWSVKDSIQRCFLKDYDFQSSFVSKPPIFETSLSKRTVSSLSPNSKKKEELKAEKERKKKERQQEKEQKKRDKKELREDGLLKKKSIEGVDEKLAKKKQATEAKILEKEKLKDEIKHRLEEKKAERKKERELKREEKRILDLYLKEWNSLKEDLFLGNLKNLPEATPIECHISNDVFGDFLMILEFVNVFSDLLEIKDHYPQGITFDMLEHALVENEIAGVFNDLLQLLLDSIFTLQKEEDEEIKDTTLSYENDPAADRDDVDLALKDAIKVANAASTWSQQFQGLPLQQAPLDALTLTEILRLHFLSSGATNVANARWRHMYRGGYKSADDPGLQFKIVESDLLKKLATSSVFGLPFGNKIKILSTLMHQILTYASVRDLIDDGFEKLKGKKNNLRVFQFAEMRRCREEHANLVLKKKEERLKKIEQVLQKVISEQPGDPVSFTQQASNNSEEDEEKKKVAEEKEERLRERRKAEHLKKEKELQDEIRSIISGLNVLPLGLDRFHRRYWLFNSISGLFVEDSSNNIGPCLENDDPSAMSMYPPDNPALLDYIKKQAVKNLESLKDEKGNSDKENDFPGKTADGVSADIQLSVLSTTNSQEEEAELQGPLIWPVINGDTYDSGGTGTTMSRLCTGDALTCSVHSVNKEKSQWLFYYDVDVLYSLLDSLNERGLRESSLKESLLSNKDRIEASLRECPYYKLNSSKEPEPDLLVRKSHRKLYCKKNQDPYLNFPSNTPTDEILDLTLRDMILEIEDKIQMGVLGSLAVLDRDKWRSDLVSGSYDKQTSSLNFTGQMRIQKLKEELGLEPDFLDQADLVFVGYKGETSNKVHPLAQAILQVSQSLDKKYLTGSLAETDKSRKKREKAERRLKSLSQKVEDKSESESDEEDADEKFAGKVFENQLLKPYERWEKSLMAATSYSQLFLHLTVFDNSVSWARSAQNARCRVCRRRRDAEKMLLCDGCDKGCHIYCLKETLMKIPSGDWYCDQCRPKEKTKSPRKKRAVYKEESDEELEPEEEEDEEHEDTEVEDNEEDEAEVDLLDNDICIMCQEGGKLVCCDSCPATYHLACLNMKKVPSGHWCCPQCCKVPLSNVISSGKNSSKVSSRSSSRRSSPAPSKLPEKRKKSVSPEEQPAAKRSKVLNGDVAKKSARRSLVDENSIINLGALHTVISNLVKHEDSWPFLTPVLKKEAPDYFEIIKKPMDLGTIMSRVSESSYSSDSEFVSDVLLVFQNCQQYNMSTSEEYKAGQSLYKYFTQCISDVGLSFHTSDVFVKRASKKRS